MSSIDDFSVSELWIIRTSLDERYCAAPELQLADIDVRLNPYGTELTPCRAAYWEHEGCHFFVC